MKKPKTRPGKQAKSESRCIICGREMSGAPIADDVVIKAIRKAKGALGVAKGSRLVVCKEDLEEHFKRRKKFEKNMVQYGAIAFVLLVAMVVLSGSLTGVVAALLIGAFILLLGLVGNYHPSLLKKGDGNA